jgi:PleD family two-component response regulator
MGVCHTRETVTSIPELFKQVDDAIYEAKKERGKIVIHPFTTK